MSNRAVITSPDAPQALGPYSQGIKLGNTIWLSGQVPLVPDTMELVRGDISAQATQVFENLSAVATAAGCTLNNAVKINISLTNLDGLLLKSTFSQKMESKPLPKFTKDNEKIL